MDGSHARARVDASFLRRHGFGAAADADPGRWQSHEHEREATDAAHADAQVRRWVIGEIGLGAALGFLSTWAAFRVHAGPDAQLDWVAVESAPLDAQTLRRAARVAAAATPELVPLINALAETWPERIPGVHRRAFDDGRVRLTLLLGEALELLPAVPFAADAWNLDGFAPARNAAAWSEEMIEQVASHSHAGTTVAAACVMPQVRARLERAGFRLEPVGSDVRAVTHGYMAREPRAPRPTARKPLPAWFAQPAPTHAREAVVIGAGLAGAAAARALAERGLRVHVLDVLGASRGSSSAPCAILAPHIASWQSPQTRVVAQAFLHARALMRRINAPLDECGLLHPLRIDDEWGHELALAEWGWPQELLGVVDSQRAAQVAALPLCARAANDAAGDPAAQGAVHVPMAGTTRPAETVAALLAHPAVTLHPRVRVDLLRRIEDGWALIVSGEGVPSVPARLLACAPIVVLATAGAWTPRLAGEEALSVDRAGALASAALPGAPFDDTRGQLSFFEFGARDAAPLPACVVAAGGFVTPPGDGAVCVGATYERGADRVQATEQDDAVNLVTVERLLPALVQPGHAPVRAGAWAGLRASLNDHCPMVGAVPDTTAFRSVFAALHDGPHAARWMPAPLLQGLFVTLAHGSRGTSTALLCGELLADIVVGGVRCVPDTLLPALLPQRFLVRGLRGGDAAM